MNLLRVTKQFDGGAHLLIRPVAESLRAEPGFVSDSMEEHLECGMQPRFRDARLRLPSATDGKRYDGPEGKRQGRMPVGGIGLGGP